MVVIRRSLLLGLCVLATLLLPAAAADAYTYVLRPNVTHVSGAWTVVGGTSAHEVLDDALLSPVIPTTATDYIEEWGNGPVTVETGLTDVTLRPGENVTRTRSYGYARTGDARSLDAELRAGATVLTSGTWPVNVPAQWSYLESLAPLTQAEVNDLRQRRTVQGSGASSPVTVYASYVELRTDLPAPAPTITASPGAIGKDDTPTWSWSSALAAGYQCRLEKGPSTVVSDWSACSGSYTPDLTAADADGDYTFRVRSVDDLGTAGPETPSTYTLDRAPPPDPTITSSPPSTAASTAAAWSFTGEAGAINSCRLLRNGVEVRAWTVCTSPESFTLTWGDGSYVFEVRSTDMATNQSGITTSNPYVLDTQAPNAPTITSSPPLAGSSATPSWSFTAEAGSTPSCRLEKGAGVVDDWAPCSSPYAPSVAGSGEGTYTFRVRTVDAATNPSGVSTGGTYTYDVTAPALPTITGGPSGPTNGPTPSFTFTAEAAATVECRMEKGATVVENWTVCSSGKSYSLSIHGDGAYTFLVRARDAAGNQGDPRTRAFLLDTVKPPAPTITGGPPTTANDAQPSFSFTAEAGSSPECRMERGATLVEDWTACANSKGYTLTTDGMHTFRVRTTDAAGNLSDVTSRTYDYDTVAPVAPTINTKPAAVTNDDTPTWTFSADFTVDKYRCELRRGAVVVIPYAVCTTPHTYSLPAPTYPDGTYTFAVRASDPAANESTETTDTFTLDRVAPNAPTVTSGPTGISRTDQPTFTFTAEAGSTTTCRLERAGTAVVDWGPCTSGTRTYNLTMELDGAYTFLVRATDAAGNTSLNGTRSYTLDRTAPVAPTITAGPTGSSNNDTPVWSFTGEPNATYLCRVEREGAVVRDWTACSTPFGENVSGHLDGGFTFRVKQTDQAGNESLPSARSYTLDRVAPPEPTLTATPPARTNTNTPAWSFTHEAGANATCRLERGAAVVDDWAPCSGSRSYDITGAPEADYTFRVRATDAANNTSVVAAHTFTRDRTAPAAPTITTGPPTYTSNALTSFAWTAEAGASAECRMERGAGVVSDWAPCTSAWPYDLTAQFDGAFTFRVRVTDEAGNLGLASARSFTLDRQAPPAPVLTARPADDTKVATPQWSWAPDADSATFRCRLTDGESDVIGWAPCSSPRLYDISGLSDGTYTFEVEASDLAGTPSPVTADSFTLDRIAPVAPAITTGPAADSNDDSPTFAFTAEAGATTACRIERGAAVVSDWGPCSGSRTYDLSGETDGLFTFRVRATDAAQNTGDAAVRSYTLDRSNPLAPTITAGPTGDQDDDMPSYAFAAEAGATMTCRLERNGGVVSDWSSCSSPRVYNLTNELDGNYTFLVRATDAAQNPGAIATRGYTLDRTAPAPPSITAGPPSDSTDDSPTFAFTAEAGATVECRLQRGSTPISDWSACLSPRTYDVSGEPDGTYTFRVRATDAARNTGLDAQRAYTLDRTVPVAPSLDGRPGDDGRDQTPTWSFSTTEANRTFECRLARGAAVISDWSICVDPREYVLTLEPDGAYTFGVRAVNLAGTRSLPTTDVYRLDTSAPVAPSISGGPPADSIDFTPTWTVSAEPGAGLECRLERGAAVVSDWTACSSPVAFDLANEPDGTYTLRTRATDAAGNVGDVGSSSYNLDRTVPLPPTFGANPPAAGSDPTPSWSFTGEPGKTFECRLTRGTATVQDWAACTSPFAPSLGGEPDGTYTVDIRAVNPAGTRGPVATDDYTLDRVRPGVPVITDGPPADSADDTPRWTFTAEAGARFECRLERGATVVSGWGACTSPESQNIAGEPDGTYTFRVRASDAAGNTSDEATRDYTLDRTVPVAPAIDTRPASPGADTTPSWTLSGDAAPIERECRLTRSGSTVLDWTTCASPFDPDVSDEPDGTYTLHVRQFNKAGTRGPEVRDDYVLDTTAAPAPVITSNPGVVGNGSVPSWAFTAEAGATLECRLERGGVTVRGWAPCTSPRDYNLSGEPDGSYRFSVRATDAAGNTGPAGLHVHELDRVAPAPPGLTAGPGPLGNGRRPVWAFDAEPGAAFECRIERDGGVVEDWGTCASPRGYDLGGQPDAGFTFSVRAIDAAGNRGGETFSPYRLDTTPGAVRIDSGPPALGRDRGPRWTFSGEAGSTFECRLGLGAAAVSDWAPCSPPRGYDLSGLPDGLFRFSLRAIDEAGNVGPVGEAGYTLDTTAPDRPAITREPQSPGTDRSPSWRFDGETGATFACRVDRRSGETVLGWKDCDSPFSADLARAPEANYRFQVRATDRAGNTGSSAAAGYELREERKDEPKRDEPGEDKGQTTTVPRTARDGGGDTEEPAAEPTRKRRKQAPAVAPRRKPKGSKAKPKSKQERRSAKKAPAAVKPGAKRPTTKKKPNVAARVGKAFATAITDHPDKSVFPLGLLLMVLAFLAVQNRLDRGDPKLALAPSFADPDLEFMPSPGNEP